MSATRRFPGTSILSILKDFALFVIGWAILFKQAGIFMEPPEHTSEILIIVAMVAIGAPGATNLAALRLGIGSPPQQPPPEVSPAPSGLSSNTGDKP